MRLFRRSLDLSQATIRLSSAEDMPRVARLFRDAAQRYHAFSSQDLPGLLAAGYGIILECEDELWGVVLIGWPCMNTTWLRGIVLSDNVTVNVSLKMLLSFLHTELALIGMQQIFFANDESSEIWLNSRLRMYGYITDTDVIVYEKRVLDAPDAGNQQITIRKAQLQDLAILGQLDQICFEAQWTKDELVLHTAIAQGPLCILAEQDGHVIGYAYASSHFGDRLVHLVRIAVDPRYRGQAVGVRLLYEVIDFARRKNASIVTLNTQAYNTQAQRLYRWFGFQMTGERQLILRHDLHARYDRQEEHITCLPE